MSDGWRHFIGLSVAMVGASVSKAIDGGIAGGVVWVLAYMAALFILEYRNGV